MFEEIEPEVKTEWINSTSRIHNPSRRIPQPPLHLLGRLAYETAAAKFQGFTAEMGLAEIGGTSISLTVLTPDGLIVEPKGFTTVQRSVEERFVRQLAPINRAQ